MLIVCPRCGQKFDADFLPVPPQLSPAAFHIWTRAPEVMRRGSRISQTVLADLTGYSQPQVSRALRELAACNLLRAEKLGTRKHAYLWPSPGILAN